MDLNKYNLIEGKFIDLRVTNEDDAEDIYRWRTSDSGNFLNQPENYSIEFQKAWMKSRSQKEINYIILSKGFLPEKVGMIAIVDIDQQNRKAEVGRLLLDAKYLNVSTPFGLEALKLTYNLVLNEWKFNKIYGSILAQHTKLIKLQMYLGMEEEGILHKHLFLHNQYLDLHLFAIFTDTLNSRYLPRINLLLRSFNFA
ncbi:MAG: GNAT family protein [Ginsengibacter sp.]